MEKRSHGNLFQNVIYIYFEVESSVLAMVPCTPHHFPLHTFPLSLFLAHSDLLLLCSSTLASFQFLNFPNPSSSGLLIHSSQVWVVSPPACLMPLLFYSQLECSFPRNVFSNHTLSALPQFHYSLLPPLFLLNPYSTFDWYMGLVTCLLSFFPRRVRTLHNLLAYIPNSGTVPSAQ